MPSSGHADPVPPPSSCSLVLQADPHWGFGTIRGSAPARLLVLTALPGTAVLFLRRHPKCGIANSKIAAGVPAEAAQDKLHRVAVIGKACALGSAWRSNSGRRNIHGIWVGTTAEQRWDRTAL